MAHLERGCSWIWTMAGSCWIKTHFITSSPGNEFVVRHSFWKPNRISFLVACYTLFLGPRVSKLEVMKMVHIISKITLIYQNSEVERRRSEWAFSVIRVPCVFQHGRRRWWKRSTHDLFRSVISSSTVSERRDAENKSKKKIKDNKASWKERRVY